MTIEQFENELDDLVDRVLSGGIDKDEIILALKRAAQEVSSGGYDASMPS